MIRTFVFAAACAVLAACATSPPPYAAASGPNAVGYSETQIESNRYYVTYRAGGASDAQLLHDYALLRAADLTLQNGREWFWVDHRSVDEANTYDSRPSFGIGIGGGSWGGRSGGSVGVGMEFPIGGGQGQRARAATLEIRFGEGPKPDDPNAYEARSTSENLRAAVTP
jgi:hypothetical protein